MALQKKVTIAPEVDVDDVYLRVERATIFNKEKLHIELTGRKNVNSEIIYSNAYQFNYDINGENPIKQAYLHLKTLPEFADAIDC